MWFCLQIEQLLQKKDKRDTSIVYQIQETYSGTVCPLYMGPRVCYGSPCTDEPRIKITKGDHVIVTRWKRLNFYASSGFIAGVFSFTLYWKFFLYSWH